MRAIGFSGQRWPQYPWEIDSLVSLFQREGVRSYLEVGCRYGDTLHRIGMALPKGSLIVGLDWPGADGGDPSRVEYLLKAVWALNDSGRDAHAIIGDSHDPKVRAQVRALAPMVPASLKMFDAAFIDGDHSWDGVRADWRDYGSMARLVAFHDIVGNCKNAQAIRPLYDELAKTHRSEAFKWRGGTKFGIGVIWRD